MSQQTAKYLRATALQLLMLCGSTTICGQETVELREYDTDTISSSDKPGRNIISRISDYFKDSNQEKEPGKFDLSFIGGPHYSKETQFGLGILAAGLYRPVGHPEAPVSNVTLYSDFATVGSYLVGIRGNHYMKNSRIRLDYKAYFYSVPSYFWGVGFDEEVIDDNKTKYKKRQAQFIVELKYRAGNAFYIGPILEFDYFSAVKPQSLTPWTGYPVTTYSYGIGAAVSYDTRDNLTAPKSGVMLMAKSVGYPAISSHSSAFGITTLEACNYQSLWKGATLASRAYLSMAHGKKIPWGLLPAVSGETLRGYYGRRFCDKNEIEILLELRQHVWRRNGVVAWVGAGEVFPEFKRLTMRRILPSFGVGYRWEFKKNINIRLDYGIGRFHESNFIFSINEAF